MDDFYLVINADGGATVRAHPGTADNLLADLLPVRASLAVLGGLLAREPALQRSTHLPAQAAWTNQAACANFGGARVLGLSRRWDSLRCHRLVDARSRGNALTAEIS
jgi:hypothetical protein